MNRLLSIEWHKLRHSRYFYVLSICFVVFMVAVPIGSKFFLDFLAAQGEQVFGGVPMGQLPMFDFLDIWQNLTWVYTSFSILLGFIILISMSDEYSYGTIKQHVIDGLSRRQFFHTKLAYIVISSAIVSLIALVIGLLTGLAWSPVKGLSFILENIEFIGAYFLHLVGFQLLCLIIALWIKRSGVAISLTIFYTYIIEPIIVGILRHRYKMDWLADLLPMEAIGNIIRFPLGRYALQETQTYVSWHDLIILIVYIVICYILADRHFGRKDLS